MINEESDEESYDDSYDEGYCPDHDVVDHQPMKRAMRKPTATPAAKIMIQVMCHLIDVDVHYSYIFLYIYYCIVDL